MRTTAKVIVAALFLAAGCAPSLRVRTDFDRAVDFRQYRTFALAESRQLSSEAQPSENTLVTDRIDRALKAQLTVKGLSPAPDGGSADLEVRYVAAAENKQELESAWDGPYVTPYYGRYGYPGDDLWVREFREGTLVIDLVDARTSKLVWRASIVSEGEGFNTPAFIRKAIARAFERFPPRA